MHRRRQKWQRGLLSHVVVLALKNRDTASWDLIFILIVNTDVGDMDSVLNIQSMYSFLFKLPWWPLPPWFYYRGEDCPQSRIQDGWLWLTRAIYSTQEYWTIGETQEPSLLTVCIFIFYVTISSAVGWGSIENSFGVFSKPLSSAAFTNGTMA